MGLFSKKTCDFCGEQIRFLGNRKVEGGNMCKNCADRLSPWFSDRRHTTVEDIRSQLEDRERNRERLSAFRESRVLGEYCTIHLDDAAGTFIPLRPGLRMSDNPDVFDLSRVTGCTWRCREQKTEHKQKDAEGKEVSYNPPRYTYSYDFLVDIRLQHPYADEITLQVNRTPVRIDAGFPREKATLLGKVTYYTPNPPETEKNAEYQRCAAMAGEMRAALTGQEKQQPAEAGPAETPEQAKVICPHCTAEVIPENGCCPYCGGKLG